VVTLRERVGEALHAQYLALSSGNDRSARVCHRLDVELRDALRPELEFVEIAMRTRYHDTMTAFRPGRPVWLLDPSLPVRDLLKRHADEQLSRLESSLQSAGETVNQISFSFWGQLTARRLEKVLWVPILHRAYLKGVARQEVHATVEEVVRLRNRVHHYEVVLGLPLRRHVDQIGWLLDHLMPDLGEERRQTSRLPALLDCLDAQGLGHAAH
jgi:hypothetical protein